jgi:hypothetical protein
MGEYVAIATPIDRELKQEAEDGWAHLVQLPDSGN